MVKTGAHPFFVIATKPEAKEAIFYWRGGIITPDKTIEL
jgi:hypothetical protein